MNINNNSSIAVAKQSLGNGITAASSSVLFNQGNQPRHVVSATSVNLSSTPREARGNTPEFINVANAMAARNQISQAGERLTRRPIISADGPEFVRASRKVDRAVAVNRHYPGEGLTQCEARGNTPEFINVANAMAARNRTSQAGERLTRRPIISANGPEFVRASRKVDRAVVVNRHYPGEGLTQSEYSSGYSKFYNQTAMYKYLTKAQGLSKSMQILDLTGAETLAPATPKAPQNNLAPLNLAVSQKQVLKAHGHLEKGIPLSSLTYPNSRVTSATVNATMPDKLVHQANKVASADCSESQSTTQGTQRFDISSEDQETAYFDFAVEDQEVSTERMGEPEGWMEQIAQMKEQIMDYVGLNTDPYTALDNPVVVEAAEKSVDYDYELFDLTLNDAPTETLESSFSKPADLGLLENLFSYLGFRPWNIDPIDWLSDKNKFSKS